jgi:hypothetical protein
MKEQYASLSQETQGFVLAGDGFRIVLPRSIGKTHQALQYVQNVSLDKHGCWDLVCALSSSFYLRRRVCEYEEAHIEMRETPEGGRVYGSVKLDVFTPIFSTGHHPYPDWDLYNLAMAAVSKAGWMLSSRVADTKEIPKKIWVWRPL